MHFFLLVNLCIIVEVVAYTFHPTNIFGFKNICARFIAPVTMAKTEPVENGVSLMNLKDFETEGRFLRDSIVRWLDTEYIPQECHVRIANKVDAMYGILRKNGVNDLGELLMEVGTGLESFDMERAFVNSWDVANKVADLLMIRMGRELCECSGDMLEYAIDNADSSAKFGADSNNPPKLQVFPTVTSTELRDAVGNFPNEFSRYIFLRNFLDGEL